MPPPLPRCSGWAYSSLISPSRVSLPRKGRRVGLHIDIFEACSAFTRVAACTLALSPIRDTLIEGFSHFVTSMTAPIASGWSESPGGACTHRKAPPCHGAHPQRTMMSGTVLSILMICLTPFFGGIFALLLAEQASRGWLQGVVQPMMFSVQAKAVGPHRQGSVVGLRQTMNRLAAIVIPPAMGVIADHWGAGQSFVILGAILIVLCVPVTLIIRRAARTATQAEPALSD